MSAQAKIIPALPQTPSYAGRILPNQEFNNYLYQGKGDHMEALAALLHAQAGDIRPDTFKLKEHHRVAYTEMSTPPAQLSLLKFLLELKGAKTFLEIGTFIGNTAMQVSRFMGEGSHVVTIEKFSEFAEIAQENFNVNGFEKSISLKQGDAAEIMKTLPDGYFDFIYVDGDKGNYLPLTQLAEKKLSAHGMILVDDILFHGDVLNDVPVTDKGRGCKDVLDYYKDTTAFSKYVLPINNGILLLSR